MFENKIMTSFEKKKFFCSNHFLKWLEQTVRNFVRNQKVVVVSSDTTATDGKVIFQNLNNEVYLNERLSKRTTTICYLADVFHENGHIEESVFEILWAIKKDDWDSSFLTTREKRIIEKEVASFVKGLTRFQRNALADINNIIEDAGMEYHQGKKYGSFVTNAFRVSNAVIMNERKSLNELEKASKYEILVEAILCFSIMGHIKGSIEDVELKTLFEKKLMPLCNKGKISKSALDRYLVAKEIFILLLPYLKELEKDTKKPYENKAKSGQNGQKNKSKQSSENGNNQEKKNPSRRPDPNLSNSMDSQGDEDTQLDNNNSQKGIPQKDKFDGIIEELSDENKDKILQEIERELGNIERTLDEEKRQKMKSLEDDLNFQGLSSLLSGNSCIDSAISINAYRSTEENELSYNEIVEKYNSVIQMFITYFRQLMKPKRNKKVYSNTGQISATKLAQYKFNPDIYEETLKVKSIPPFSIILLIDASYSMTTRVENGLSRIENAKVAAVILNEVFSSLNIPIAILSHAAKYPKMEMVCFKNFDSPSYEKYRLGAIDVNHNCGGSRDGYAIRFVNEMVKQRKEQVVVLSISDGAPTDTGYGEKAAQEDTKKAVEELLLIAKKCVGISIANNNEVDEAIKFIYEKNHITISDLSILPTALLNAIV